jgi:hypothetical protein
VDDATHICRRRLRVRQPVQQRVRHEHGGAEHGAVQRRRGLRVLLPAALRRRRAVVPAGHHHRHGHQLLPAKLRPSQRRRRMVQPAAPALRHGRARLPPHRAVPRRHRARRIQKVLWRLTTFWLDQPRMCSAFLSFSVAVTAQQALVLHSHSVALTSTPDSVVVPSKILSFQVRRKMQLRPP